MQSPTPSIALKLLIWVPWNGLADPRTNTFVFPAGPRWAPYALCNGSQGLPDDQSKANILPRLW